MEFSIFDVKYFGISCIVMSLMEFGIDVCKWGFYGNKMQNNIIITKSWSHLKLNLNFNFPHKIIMPQIANDHTHWNKLHKFYPANIEWNLNPNNFKTNKKWTKNVNFRGIALFKDKQRKIILFKTKN
jgi:hypothetical protein